MQQITTLQVLIALHSDVHSYIGEIQLIDICISDRHKVQHMQSSSQVTAATNKFSTTAPCLKAEMSGEIEFLSTSQLESLGL